VEPCKTETPQEANKFLDKPDDFAAEIRKQGDASAREGVERVLEVLVSSNCTTYQDCVSWVRLHFQVREPSALLISDHAKDGTQTCGFAGFVTLADARAGRVPSGVPRVSSV
jgi:hypothetical protein